MGHCPTDPQGLGRPRPPRCSRRGRWRGARCGHADLIVLCPAMRAGARRARLPAGERGPDCLRRRAD
eukprot:7009628-Prymnesium_polylepis.1